MKSPPEEKAAYVKMTAKQRKAEERARRVGINVPKMTALGRSPRGLSSLEIFRGLEASRERGEMTQLKWELDVEEDGY